MVSPINANLPAQYARAPAPRFNEGAGATARAVGALALTVISAFASFVFLPANMAVGVTAALALIYSALCCCGEGARLEDGVLENRVVARERWYQPIVNAMPRFVQHMGHPVLNRGPRVPVGGQPYFNAQPVDARPVVFARQQEAARVPVDRGHGHMGVAALPPAMAPNQRPPAHQAGARVPVGHAHR